MGLGSDEEVVVEDSDGVGGGGGCGGKSYGGSVSCSICLEVVADNGDRSWAKLQCGHQFHLGESKLNLIWVEIFIFPGCNNRDPGSILVSDLEILLDIGFSGSGLFDWLRNRRKFRN